MSYVPVVAWNAYNAAREYMMILAYSSRDTTHTLISSHSATHYAFLAARLGPFFPSLTGLSDLTQLAFGFR